MTLRPARRPAVPALISAAALLEGPAGVALHLRGEDGSLLQLALSPCALREIAALAGAALAAVPVAAQAVPSGG